MCADMTPPLMLLNPWVTEKLPQLIMIAMMVGLCLITRATAYGDLYYGGFFVLTSGFLALPLMLPDDEKMINLVVAVTSCLYGITAAVIGSSILIDRWDALISGSCVAAGNPVYFCCWNVAFWFLFISISFMATEACWGALHLDPKRAATRYWLVCGRYAGYLSLLNGLDFLMIPSWYDLGLKMCLCKALLAIKVGRPGSLALRVF